MAAPHGLPTTAGRPAPEPRPDRPPLPRPPSRRRADPLGSPRAADPARSVTLPGPGIRPGRPDARLGPGAFGAAERSGLSGPGTGGGDRPGVRQLGVVKVAVEREVPWLMDNLKSL